MPTELVNLELEEVSLVDAGDDPLAKVAIFKRSPEGEDMEKELAEEPKVEETDKGYKEEKMSDDMDDEDSDMMEGPDDKKPTRKSWKAEAQSLSEANEALLQEVETFKAKVAELEAAAVAKSAPVEEMVDVDGEMIAKSAIPAPILKKLEEVEKAQEAMRLAKRANEVIPNFKGTEDQRSKLIKVAGDDEELLSMLRAADALFATMFSEVGKSSPDGEMKDPADKLNELAKAHAADKGVSFEKGFAAVIKTAEGKELYKASLKK